MGAPQTCATEGTKKELGVSQSGPVYVASRLVSGN